ncbi:MAG TPA: hypothetical protein VHY09_01350 [Candidatus Methylacidiphilales bacterium]|jgi:hypothetical protein|nr:hypothetical protein [Candidatus Methylacidiphilales bacterium]
MKIAVPCLVAAAALAANIAIAISMERPALAVSGSERSLPARNRIDQTQAEADAKSVACLACHHGVENMHNSPNVVLGCTDCHGGNATAALEKQFTSFAKDKAVYDAFKNASHVQPLNKEFWKTSANPARSTVLLNHESAEFIQFMNPGDLRVAEKACGICHGAEFHQMGGGDDIITQNTHSMMNHGAMLWGAAAYNNGAWFTKNALFGQDYSAEGEALALVSPFKPTPEQTQEEGFLPEIIPLPRFEVGEPGNIFRVFEKGGVKPTPLGLPDPDEDPGKPMNSLSDRGYGTNTRIDPTVLNAQKTRLHDPLLGFLGSNDHPGDYRSSGCSACHVVYANDRSPFDSGWYAKYGNQGLSYSMDPAIPKNERGHPIKHQFTTSIPSSQCMICHMHQGNCFVNPYLGYTWWDQETDGEYMYPKIQHDPTDEEAIRSWLKNPEGAVARGLWGDLDFLEKVSELNPKLKDTQFADYHGHGWNFRAVFKKDRHGDLLDANNKIIAADDPDKFGKAVHLKDIHLEKGMQCVDCHFMTDVHGNGMLYGETRAATAITCVDCHGTIDKRPTLMTSGKGGPVGPDGKIQPLDLNNEVTAWGPRFYWQGNRLFQRSAMSPDITWEIPQTVDVIDPLSPKYNALARYAKTLLRDGKSWGAVPATPEARKAKLAHDNANIDCQICHSSWVTSCFGCHIPMRANERVNTNKFEGTISRNFSTYNPQVVRDDVFMLGRDSTVKDHRLAIIRSSSALVVSSQNNNREWVYSQEQTVSWEGYSGQAFNPHFPHTTSGVGTTKNCTDCHLSAQMDNNAIMAQLLGFGTGNVNFFGRYSYVGAGSAGIYGIVWTEQDEPQAAIGSHLQRIAYPRDYQAHLDNKRVLKEAYHHDSLNIFGGHVVQDVTLRGEYLYTAAGSGGLEVDDVAEIDQKGFSQRVTSAPVSPLGQRTYVRTPYATSVALPSTLMEDPKRKQTPVNEERPIHPLYNYVYVTDLKEGLVIVDVSCLFNGDPQDNFLHKDAVFNPDHKLDGAMKAFVAGRYLYVACARGIEVVDIDKPLQPQLVGEYSGSFLNKPVDVSVQFQYLFVSDAQGLKVLNIADPTRPLPVEGGVVALRHPHRLYVARDYVYVADGADGLAIIDIEKAEQPRLTQMFTANGAINDARAVQIGSIAASMFALVADGKNGLRVVQVVSPDTVPEAAGFDPKPNPQLIATYPTEGEALAVSRGLDRDRVCDESGNQTVVFGRRGAGPLTLEDMNRLLRHSDGSFFRVSDVHARGNEVVTSTGEKIPTPPEDKNVAQAPQPAAPPTPAPVVSDAQDEIRPVRPRPN